MFSPPYPKLSLNCLCVIIGPLIMDGSDGISTDPPQKRFPAVTRVRNNLRKLFPRDKSGGLSRPGSQ
jgi:hypothetical protein